MKWVLARLLEYGSHSVRLVALTALQLGRFVTLQPALMTAYAAELQRIIAFGVRVSVISDEVCTTI